MSEFPAILIGGPPHSGKSVLAYQLTKGLRQRRVDHYVLRAYPDGEGDWSYEADQSLVRAIRIKSFGDEKWVARIHRDIARRHLPLIVDVGGRPTPFQETLFDECTHAVLLWPDEHTHQEWLARVERHGLPLIADLHSSLAGPDEIVSTEPIVRGTISGLDRLNPKPGPAFDVLLEKVARLFATDTKALRRKHILEAPVDLAIDIEKLAVTLRIPGGPTDWHPDDIPALLDYLPGGRPLGVYGRAPCWLYAVLAVYSLPAEFWQFDARYGWIKPPELLLSDHWDSAPWQVRLMDKGNDSVELAFALRNPYIDLLEADRAPIPDARKSSVILSGKLPCWLYTASARIYTAAGHHVFIFYPQISSPVPVAR